MKKLFVVGAMRTDIGSVRKVNEDSVAFVVPADSEPGAKLGFLAIVADGMGGHAAGEVASALAVDIVTHIFFSLDTHASSALKTAFKTANRTIFEYGLLNRTCYGMGTTGTAIAIRDNQLWLAHVGDSRAYLMRDGGIRQLSDDQTFQAQFLRSGTMTASKARKTPASKIILQALGTRPSISPTIWDEGLPLRKGDKIILCSDGLYDLVSDDQIAKSVAGNMPYEACRHLVDTALAAGGHDNISVGVFAIESSPKPNTGDQAETKRILIADRYSNASTIPAHRIPPSKA